MEQTELDKLTDAVMQAIEDKKAIEPLVIDVRGRFAMTDRFVIASGRSDRHLKAMAEAVGETARRFGLPMRIEGLQAMEWLLIDLADVVVHLFLPEIRDAFRLEQLWGAPHEKEGGEAGA